MHAALLMGFLALAGSPPVHSGTAADIATGPIDPSPAEMPGRAPADILDMEPVVVSGVQPGPGMWKVSRDGHVLWVLGVVSALPTAMEWQSQDVEAVVQQSGAVLSTPVWSVHSDVGVFKGLTLLPSALRARRNPDGAGLRDVLAPDVHARWQVQKDKYLGWELGIERWRPMFAAEKLEREAMERLGLGDDVVGPVVRAAAKRAGLELTPVQVKSTIEAPRELLKEFRAASFDDAVCLERTVAVLEHELPTLAARASAWATGDLDTLRRLPQESLRWNCLAAVLDSDIGRRLGYADLPSRVEQAWLEAAEDTLAEHRVAMALLPMREVLAPEGFLAKLQARGYTVEAP